MSSLGFNLPSQLVENIAQGKCVLFLGADAAYDADGWVGPPSRAQLASALADKYDWVASRHDLCRAADEFLSREPPDEHALREFVKTQAERCLQPGPIHQALVALGFDALVTGGYDELLYDAMRRAGRRILKVVGDTEIAYAGNGEEVILIHLMGVASQPDSLVLTHDDLIAVENHLSEKLQTVRGWCTLRPLLFLGWNPEDESLRRLYSAATEKFGKHQRRNYIVWPDPSPVAAAQWKRKNVEIIRAEPLPFLRALERAIGPRRQLKPGYRPGEFVRKPPYKFLNYYDPDDRDIFCGREVQAPLVYRMALSYPTLTLFGQSGVGKTSLLRAGVIPLLLEESYHYAYVRALGDPLQAIRQAVCQALKLPDCAGDTLSDFFRQALGSQGRLVVILDQFEELFLRTSEETRRQFWRELSDCLPDAAPPAGQVNPQVHFIFCLREDFLPELDEARHPLAEGEPAPIPTILRDSYRLTSLAADTAYLAIVEPARRARCAVEPQLAEVILGRADFGELSRADPSGLGKPEGSVWSLAEANGTIPPPSLQIVMDRLYRQALTDAGHKLPAPDLAGRDWEPPALTLTLEQYRALGGAGKILAEYVTSALDDVPRRGGDRQMAEALLKVMVTSQKTKAALDDAEMRTELAEADPDFDAQDSQRVDGLRNTRAALVNLRLVRSFQVGERALYELAHDHIAAEIATWISQQEMQAKLARELLRREMDSWRGLGKLIEPGALRLLHERRETLRRLSAGELELLLRSALAVGYEAAYWFDRARAVGVAVDEIALAGLRAESFRARAAAVNALAQLGVGHASRGNLSYLSYLTGMLADDYPQVRVAAILALEKLQPSGEWRRHLKYECYVPAGKFIMGDDKGASDEKPAHEVDVAAFYIGKYPVTNVEYKRYVDDLGRAFQVLPGKDHHPVVKVSWYDARDYAAWAAMRLLTEAEWEKAASWEDAGSKMQEASGGKQAAKGRKLKYPWGDEFDEARCNTSESGIGTTTPVGKYSPQGDSPYGCADMAGNVWEWTSSRQAGYPYKADAAREDMTSSDPRVRRGGSFNNYGGARCAYRDHDYPYFRWFFLGFRCGVGVAFPISLK